MIDTFSVIEGGIAILSVSGRYGNYPIYSRGNAAFAEIKGSYIKLNGGGRTSVPNTLWHEFEATGLSLNKLGVPAFGNHTIVRSIAA